jgi:hypothetical protein
LIIEEIRREQIRLRAERHLRNDEAKNGARVPTRPFKSTRIMEELGDQVGDGQ